MKMKYKIIVIAFYVYAATCWAMNLISFLKCDFSPIGKEEIIHGIGVFFPPASMVIVWF